MSVHSGNQDMSSVLATLLNKFATIESKLDACNARIASQESQIQGIERSTGAAGTSQRLSNDDDSASVLDEHDDYEVEYSAVDVARSDTLRAVSETAPRPVVITTPPEPARINRSASQNSKRVRIKDSPPKFSGRNEDYVAWSEQFLSYATHWGFSNVLFKERGIDVSDPRKSDADYLREGVELDTLHEYQNAWYSLLRSAGSIPVQRMIVNAKDVGTAWSCVGRDFAPIRPLKFSICKI